VNKIVSADLVSLLLTKFQEELVYFPSQNLYLWYQMQKEQGIEVVCAAICAGIFNDLGSGSNVDLCVITKVFCLTNLGLQGCE
jgi:20S proteasome alpha/beta subunit